MPEVSPLIPAPVEATAVPPRQRLYYGYFMVLIAMAALMATAPGQTYGVSTFNESLRTSLGLSHSALSAAYMVGTLLAALPLTYFGLLLDRHGIRKAMVAASLALGAACLVTASAVGWWSLLAGFLMLRLSGAGALGFVSGNTLPHWFHRRLGTVEGIRWMGGALAMGGSPMIFIALIDSLGWRTTYAALGVGVWAVMLPLCLLVRNRPEETGQEIDGGFPPGAPPPNDDSRPTPDMSEAMTLGQTLRTGAFWIVAAGTALIALIYTAVFFHSVPMMTDRGMAASMAAALIGGCAGSLILMQVVAGILSDRFPAPLLLATAMGVLMAALGLLRLAETALAVQAAGVLMGAAQGLYLGVSQPLWARYFGRLNLGKVRGAVSTLNVASSSVGPLLFGLCRDSLGSFDVVMTAAAFSPLPLLLLMPLATPPASRDWNPEATHGASTKEGNDDGHEST